jgi:CBS domain.
MAERKVRRVPVVDESGCCVGIIAQADIARKAGDDHEVAKVVERVSEPTSGARDESTTTARL